jgi:ketosteroid isomerase-like protein
MRHVACATALMLMLALLAGCHRAPAEQQIRDAIASAAGAARVNDTSGVLDVVSEDFTGNEGDLDRRGLRRLLAVRAFRQDKTGILIGPIVFEQKGGRMLARFNLVLTGGKQGDLLPDQSAVYAMTTAWRLEGDEWKCYNATWRRAGR